MQVILLFYYPLHFPQRMTQTLSLSQLSTSQGPKSGSKGGSRQQIGGNPNNMASSYTVCMDAIEKSRNSPGVGAYDISKSYASKRQPGFTFGLGYSKHKLESSAGPGSYNIDTSAINYANGKSFSRSQRSISAQSNTPDCVGPNSYNIEQRSDSRGFTLGQRHRSSSNQSNPGVGAYDIDSRLSEKGTSNMGSRYNHFMNMYSVSSKTPSVGAYDIDVENKERKGKGFSFGKEVKKVDYNGYPGVGAYNIDKKKKPHAGSTFGARTKICLK